MKEVFSKIIYNGESVTKVIFHFDNDLGLNPLQISEIYRLAEKYLKEYPNINIPVICDYCYMDHDEVNEENYLYDDTGEKYKDRTDYARYFWDDAWIGFNHILCHSLEINYSSLSWENKKIQNVLLGDVKQIKQYESAKTIRTIFIHEFAHAIEWQYRIFEDSEMNQLYKNNNQENQFSDIHEFIAECFVVNEYIPYNRLARKVGEIMGRCVK